MATYFNFAHAVERRGACKWPYDIGICFEEVACPIGFAEGIGQGVGAITVTAAAAISDTWKKHFEATGAHWLLGHIERLVAGRPLAREQMFQEYLSLHGEVPEVSTLWF